MLEQFLTKLVSFKTVSLDQAENRKALDWFKQQIKDLPVYFKDLNYKGFPALLVTTKKTKRPKILLQGHVDVVGGSQKLFKAKISKGKIFGRGVFDMKFAAACYLTLLKDLKNDLKKLDIGILLTTDEELGGRNGVRAFLNSGYSANFFILPDGGTGWALQKSTKGILRVTVTSTGVSGHGSRPWTGVSAIENLTEFLVQLKKFFPIEPCKDRLHFHSTLNVGFINGGLEANKIADSSLAKLDIRIIPGDQKQILKKIFKLQKKFPTIGVNIESQDDPYTLPVNHRLYKNFVEILKQEINSTPKFFNGHGASDARYFIAKQIPGIVFRPVGGGHHSENEWVEIKSLHQLCRILKQFVITHG